MSGQPRFTTDTIVPGDLFPSLDMSCCYKRNSQPSFQKYRGHGSGIRHAARRVVHVSSKLVKTPGGVKAPPSPFHILRLEDVTSFTTLFILLLDSWPLISRKGWPRLWHFVLTNKGVSPNVCSGKQTSPFLSCHLDFKLLGGRIQQSLYHYLRRGKHTVGN